MSDVPGTPSPGTTTETLPGRRTVTFTIDTSELPRATTAVGVALASAAVSTSLVFSRESGDLDRSVFAVGAVATLLMLAVAAWAYLVRPGSDRSADLVSYPGAAGVIGAGLMLGVLLDDGDSTTYLCGGLVLVLGVAGYLLARSWPFVVVALAGAAVVYAQAVSDLTGGSEDSFFGSDDGPGNEFIVISIAITVFVLVATVGGWFLPQTRVLTGVLSGIGGLFALAGVMEVLMISRVLTANFTPDVSFQDDASGGTCIDDPDCASFEEPDSFLDTSVQVLKHNPFKDDIYTVLGLCALLAVFWLGCSLASGHLGFRLLVIADSVVMVPMVLMALAVRTITWWGAGLAVVGIAVLVLTAFRTRPQYPTPAVRPATA